MYESTDYTAIIVVSILLYAIVFGIACSYLGKSKNRDPVSYFFLGFFLGIIGLIVAAGVPRLEETRGQNVGPINVLGQGGILAYYLKQGNMNSEVMKGKLVATQSGLGFVKGDNVIATLPYKKIVLIEPVARNDARQISKQMLGSGGTREVIRIVHLEKDNEATSCFSFVRIGILSILQRAVNQSREGEPIKESIPEERKCPCCAEMIKAEAVRCRFCGADLLESVPRVGTGVATITHDIKIGDQLAFTKGEQIEIESINPDPNRPEYRNVVLSKGLNKRFRLSDRDISVS